MFASGAQSSMSLKRRRDSEKKAKDIQKNSPRRRRQSETIAEEKIQTKSESVDSKGTYFDLIKLVK